MTRRFRGPKPTAPVRRNTGCSSNRADPPGPAGGAAPPEAALAADRSTRTQAWTAFWLEQGADSRCLANIRADGRRSLNDHWSAFASMLAPSSRILDIGCGAGIVGRALLAAQDAFRITGIDLAGVPAPGDRRIALLAGTAMEKLPFDDGSFDAAVSQFGFEYGDVREAAKELARVLVPGAPFSFVVHHAASSIVHHSLTRNRALRALLGEAVRRAFLSGNAVELDRHILSIRRCAPAEAIVPEVALALRARLGRGDAHRSAIWSAVAAALAPELEILGALETSCVAPAKLARWLAAFAGRFEIGTASAMRRPTGEAVAWKIEGVKRGTAGQISQKGPVRPCAANSART